MTEFKQFLINKLILFFMLTTLILLAIAFIGSVFDGDARFGYDAILAPMEYAFLCVLPTFVTYSRRELKPKELLFRNVLEFLLIEAIVLGVAFHSALMDTTRISVVLTIAGSVLIIFLLVHIFAWVKESIESLKMNQALVELQKRVEDEGKCHSLK